jgi:hypothetical protein
MLEFTKQPVRRTRGNHLGKGHVILYKGKYYLFDRIPKGANSIYVKDMETMKYLKIPLNKDISELHFDLAGYCDINSIQPPNNILDLQNGDLFVVNHETKGSFIFRFERSTERTIIATDPINNKEMRISVRHSCTKIENLPF